MTTTEFFRYLINDERTHDLGAELQTVFELRLVQPVGADAAATSDRVPIAAA